MKSRYYRPQRSCEAYVFTRVCLSTEGEYLGRYLPPLGPGTPSRTSYTPLRPDTPTHPLGPDTTPRTRYTPWDQVHPLGPGTPPRTRYTSSRRLLLRTVRILLECILVLIAFPIFVSVKMNRFFRIEFWRILILLD